MSNKQRLFLKIGVPVVLAAITLSALVIIGGSSYRSHKEDKGKEASVETGRGADISIRDDYDSVDSDAAYVDGDNQGYTDTDIDAGAGSSRQDARYIQLPKKSDALKPKESYYDYSNEKLAWWFKRNDDHRPSGCDDTLDISLYGGYYLDTYVSEDDKVIYLTFDCGYENGFTDQILDVLAAEDVPACFFVTQTFIRDNVDIVKRMKAENHQVGNHTITHPSLPKKSYEEIIDEICGCADYMREVTGYDMDPYLRPPCGEYSERTLAITHDLGFKTIFWSMAYLDYDVNKQPGVDYVVNHFNRYHHNGAIILMHNVSSSNAGALETVIRNLKAEGYRFASLNELD